MTDVTSQSQSDFHNELNACFKTAEAPQACDQKNKVLVLDTYGGAGHVATANKITKECISEGKIVIRQSLCSDPQSPQKSWVRLCGIDIGKRVVAYWNKIQHNGHMGLLTSSRWFCLATLITDILFSFFAKLRMFNCLAKNNSITEVHDSQPFFTKDFSEAIEKFNRIKNDLDANYEYNSRVIWNNLLRKNKFLRIFANPAYKYKIHCKQKSNVTYHKYLTETPQGAYNYYVPFSRLSKKVALRFHSIYAPPLTQKENRLRDKVKFHLKNSIIITREIWKNLFSENKMRTKSELFEKLGPDKANAIWKEYTLAYLLSRCPRLAHLDHRNFIIDSGPIAQEFNSKVHASFQERLNFRKNIPIKLERQAFELIKDRQTCLAKAQGTVNIPPDSHLSAISLGSQAEVKATVDYVKAKLEIAKAHPEQSFFIVPFCGTFKGDMSSAFGRLRGLLFKKVPDNVTLLPLTFQSPETMSRIFASADELFIRTGGLTTMEVAAVVKPSCMVNIHAPGKSLNKKALWGQLLLWEKGNARYLQAVCGTSHAGITNPTLYKQKFM